MLTFTYLLYAALTLVALATILYSFRKKSESAAAIAIWTDLLAILLLYRLARGEILGLFFNYTNGLLYTINLIILILSISYIIAHSRFFKANKMRRYTTATISSLLIVGGILLLINVWTNAYFIETRKAGIPVLQVATLGHNPHCQYAYVFYKITPDGNASYMCPNYYGLIPRIGRLDTVPSFIEHQFGISRLHNKS